MMLHWILKNNTCSLTIIEKIVRYYINDKKFIKNEDCFTCRLIEPIYDVTNIQSEFTVFLYSATIILWLITVYKIFYKYKSGVINNYIDLFSK